MIIEKRAETVSALFVCLAWSGLQKAAWTLLYSGSVREDKFSGECAAKRGSDLFKLFRCELVHLQTLIQILRSCV